MATDSWEPVQPEGLALALYITTVVLSVLCTIVVGLRTYIRTWNECIGIDDYLMCTGLAAYIGHNIIVSIGCHRGIGTTQSTLVCYYTADLLCNYSSLCEVEDLIAIEKKYVRILQTLIVISVALSAFGIIFIIVQCRPFEAHWKPSKGTCFSKIIPTLLTYASSVSNVVTDFAVAVIPMRLVRKLQMRRKLKLYAQLIMALGMLASTASLVRIPYSNAYMKPKNFVLVNIILWKVVKCGVGVFAGSLPSLRAFFKSLVKDWSTNDQRPSNNTTDLLIIGRIRGRSSRITETELGTHQRSSNDCDDGAQNDDDSQRRIIVQVTKSFRVNERQSDEDQSYGERTGQK